MFFFKHQLLSFCQQQHLQTRYIMCKALIRFRLKYSFPFQKRRTFLSRTFSTDKRLSFTFRPMITSLMFFFQNCFNNLYQFVSTGKFRCFFFLLFSSPLFVFRILRFPFFFHPSVIFIFFADILPTSSRQSTEQSSSFTTGLYIGLALYKE